MSRVNGGRRSPRQVIADVTFQARYAWASPTFNKWEKIVAGAAGLGFASNFVAGFFSVGDQTYNTVNTYNSATPLYSNQICISQEEAERRGLYWRETESGDTAVFCSKPGDVAAAPQVHFTSQAEQEYEASDTYVEQLAHFFTGHRVTPGAWIWLVCGAATGLAFGAAVGAERHQAKGLRAKREDIAGCLGPEPEAERFTRTLLDQQRNYEPKAFVADLRSFVGRLETAGYPINHEALENLCVLLESQEMKDEMKLAARYDAAFEKEPTGSNLAEARQHEYNVVELISARLHVDGPIVVGSPVSNFCANGDDDSGPNLWGRVTSMG